LGLLFEGAAHFASRYKKDKESQEPHFKQIDDNGPALILNLLIPSGARGFNETARCSGTA